MTASVNGIMGMGPSGMMSGNMNLNGGGDMMGWLEVCRRVGVFVLTMPMRGVWVGEPGDSPAAQQQQGGGSEVVVERKRRRGSPPLLPVFMHLVIPSIIHYIDNLKATVQDQTNLIEILTTIVFSSLTAALHLEWALTNIGTLLATARKIMPRPKERWGRELRLLLVGSPRCLARAVGLSHGDSQLI